MSKKTNVGKLQRIVWDDHFSTNGSWVTVDQLNFRPHVNETIGKIVYEDKKAVVLASSWSHTNDLFNDPIYILKSCITKRTNVK